MINKLYIDLEKKIFLFLSCAMALMTTILCIQYFIMVGEVTKMQRVKEEYHHHIDLLKKVIQEKNCDVAVDDLDAIDEDKDQEEDLLSDVKIPSELFVDQTVIVTHDEDILDEQDEDTHKFQFISAEDEKQLKDLRKHTRQVVLARKKVPKKNHKTLGSKQIAQLAKTTTRQVTQDFSFHWPLEIHHFWLSSLFGARKKADGSPGFHYGIDLAAMKGTPVKAAAAGKVIQAQYVPGYGNNILIQHNKYYRTRYAHLDRIHVTTGNNVTQGQKIGTVGDSGSVRKNGRDASHLHFEIYHNGSHVNPLRYLFS